MSTAMSPPIAVADATPVTFRFDLWQTSALVQVRFYTDAAATEAAQLSPLGTGSRNITASMTVTALQDEDSPGDAQIFAGGNIDGAAPLVAVPDGKWEEIDLGSGSKNLTIVSAANVTPGSAVSYRIIVSPAVGSSV